MSGERTGRVPTGIKGLDAVLEGGFLEGGVYIIEGAPGVGKTTLGSHFCFNHAASGKRAVYLTLLAESHTRLLGHLRRMRFFDPSFVPDRVSYLSAFKVLEAEGLPSLLKLVRQTIAAHKASVVVLDGLVSAEEASPSAKEFKKFIHELQVVTAMTGCVALLLNSAERPRAFRAERTMVDGIIELEEEVRSLRAVRHLIVRKMRGTNPTTGKHYMEISDEGVRVLPRIETVGVHAGLDRALTPAVPSATFDIEQLDAMLHGGLPGGSITALIGPTGSGKSILGMHFLDAGLRRGEPAVYFGFFERPAAVLVKARRLGFCFEQAQEKGLLRVYWNRPVEGVIDVFADRLIAAVKSTGASRLFIDGLQGFQAGAENEARLREVLSCVVDELENLGVTSVYSSETPDLFGEELRLSMLGMSALTHNILLLNRIERTQRTRRSLTVLKVRDGDHDLSVREFAITNQGIRVAEASPGVATSPVAEGPKRVPSRLNTKATKQRKRRA